MEARMKKAKVVLVGVIAVFVVLVAAYLWSTLPGRYQVARIGDNMFVQINTATGELWVLLLHEKGDAAEVLDRVETTTVDYGVPFPLLRRLNVTGRPQ
jgi:hypothetical protein